MSEYYTIDELEAIAAQKYYVGVGNAQVNSMDEDFSSKLSQLGADFYAEYGRPLRITSGFRSHEHQKRIYATARPGYAAKPGTSRHEKGMAVDVHRSDIDDLNKLDLSRHGLMTGKGWKHSEPWHIQALEAVGNVLGPASAEAGQDDEYYTVDELKQIASGKDSQEYYTVDELEKIAGIEKGGKAIPLSPDEAMQNITPEIGLVEQMPDVRKFGTWAKEGFLDYVAKTAAMTDPASFQAGQGIMPSDDVMKGSDEWATLRGQENAEPTNPLVAQAIKKISPFLKDAVDATPETRRGFITRTLEPHFLPEGRVDAKGPIEEITKLAIGSIPDLVSLWVLGGATVPLAGTPLATGVTFGLYGGMTTPESPLKGAGMGVLAGTTLGIVHKATAQLADPVARWVTRLTGAAATGAGAARLEGASPEDIAKSAVLFAMFELGKLPKDLKAPAIRKAVETGKVTPEAVEEAGGLIASGERGIFRPEQKLEYEPKEDIGRKVITPEEARRGIEPKVERPDLTEQLSDVDRLMHEKGFTKYTAPEIKPSVVIVGREGKRREVIPEEYPPSGERGIFRPKQPIVETEGVRARSSEERRIELERIDKALEERGLYKEEPTKEPKRKREKPVVVREGQRPEPKYPFEIPKYERSIITPKEGGDESLLYGGGPSWKQIYKYLTTGEDYRINTPQRFARSQGAREVEDMYARADAALATVRDRKPGDIRRALVRSTLDVGGNVKAELLRSAGAEGKEAVMRHDLSRGANAKSEQIVNEAMDRVYTGLTPAEETQLNNIIQSRRTMSIDAYKPDTFINEGLKDVAKKTKLSINDINYNGIITKNNKQYYEYETTSGKKYLRPFKEVAHPEGLGGNKHQEYLNELPPEVQTKLFPRADEFFKTMRDNLAEARDAGLISDQQYQDLIDKGDYSKRKFIQYIDPEVESFDARGRKITVPDPGIDKLGEGSTELLEKNSRLLMSEVISRTQARIMKNLANEALYQVATQVPGNGIVRLNQRGAEPKPNESVVKVMRDGKPVEMVLPNKFAREWVQSDPLLSITLANTLGWLSGNKILKALATGMNPGFALTNLPRDIAHIWLVTGEYSSFGPKYLAQIAGDLGSTLKDAVGRKGAYKDYINEGGGMGFLTHQGQMKLGSGLWGTMQKYAGWLGEFSEIWTRLAVRNRAMKNGASPTEATWIARNYLDFAQGGSFAKAADSMIPYLNASIQGTRRIGSAAKSDPGTFAYKMAQVGALATGLYLANSVWNKDAYEQISDREKVNNWIVTTPFSYQDKDGNKRYVYFKIAKDQGQRAMASAFEGMMGMALGHKVDGDQIAMAVADFLPIVPTELIPPTMSAILGYWTNKDFWRNRDIWYQGFGQEVQPKEEWNKFTHPLAVKAGKYTGLSPARLEYALGEIVPPTNTFVGLVGGGLRHMMDDIPEKDREKMWAEVVSKIPMIDKVVRSTIPSIAENKQIKEIKVTENTRRLTQKRDIEALVDEHGDKPEAKKFPVYKKYILSQPKEDRKRLIDKIENYEAYYNIPDRRYWLNLKSLPPEQRAIVFHDRLRRLPKQEANEFLKQADKLPGIATKDFMKKFDNLYKRGKQ